MTRLRYIAVALLLVTGLLLNLERLDVGAAQNIVILHPLIYLVGVAAVLTTLLLPVTGRISQLVWLAVWLGVYLALRLVDLPARPLVGGFATYITLTEIGLLAVLVMLSHSFSRELNEINEIFAAVVLPAGGKRARHFDDASQEVEREFVRSRRNNLLMSLLIVQPDPGSLKANLQRAVEQALKSLKKRYLYSYLGQTISKEMRRTDLVLEQPEKDRFILLLPDTNDVDARRLMERIRNTAGQEIGIRVQAGAASFPQQALTLEDMIRFAESDLQLSPRVEFTSNGQPHPEMEDSSDSGAEVFGYKSYGPTSPVEVESDGYSSGRDGDQI